MEKKANVHFNRNYFAIKSFPLDKCIILLCTSLYAYYCGMAVVCCLQCQAHPSQHKASPNSKICVYETCRQPYKLITNVYVYVSHIHLQFDDESYLVARPAKVFRLTLTLTLTHTSSSYCYILHLMLFWKVVTLTANKMLIEANLCGK